MHNLLVPAIAAVSIISTAFSGLNLYEVKISPPVITGWAKRVSPVVAGETIILEWNIRKNTDCAGEAGRVWVGENGFLLSEVQRAATIKKSESVKKYRIQTKIPELAPTGKLILSIKGHYTCESGDKYFTLGPVNLTVKDK